ncbi:hypothetical protein IMG5_023220, partial [Ichthyophthirius multifiliis]
LKNQQKTQMYQNKTSIIVPGYTGHIPFHENNEDQCQINGQKFHIPGYAGYIPSIKSENVYGKTYGKSTYMSINNQLHKGINFPKEMRYTTTVNQDFQDQKIILKKEIQCQNEIQDAQEKSHYLPKKERRYIDPIEYKEKQIIPVSRCNLTYEEAYKQAYLKKPQVVFVLGGPGCGKGTQCEKIVRDFGFKHLSAGDLLREEMQSGSEHAKLIDYYIKEGKIVPKEIIVQLIKNAMEKHGQEKNKFLIDGYPRSWENVQGWNSVMEDIIDFKFILFFDCSEDTMTKRVMKRSQGSGRSDDNLESLKKRFKTFRDETLPVVEYYKKTGHVVVVNAEDNPEEVYKQIQGVFKNI